MPREDRPGSLVYAAWATNISVGAASEAGQHLTATVELLPLQPGDPKALEFEVPPMIDLATGDLRFTIKHRIDASVGASNREWWVSSAGLARVRVTLQDDGGTAGGGQDSSSAEFTIFLNPAPAARDLFVKHPWKTDCIPIALVGFDADTDPEPGPDYVPLVSPYPFPKVEIVSNPTKGFLQDGGRSGGFEDNSYYGAGTQPVPPALPYGARSYNYVLPLCYQAISSTFVGFDTVVYRVIDPDGNVSAPASITLEIFEN